MRGLKETGTVWPLNDVAYLCCVDLAERAYGDTGRRS